MSTCMMIPVICYGAIMLVAFTTTSLCYHQNGFTAMIWAVTNGHKDIVEYLVGQGADKDIKKNVSTRLLPVYLFKMIYMHLYTFECMRVCMYVCMYVCLYICVYMIIFATCIYFCICNYYIYA